MKNFFCECFQAFLKIQIFSQLSNVVRMEDRQRNLSWICLSLAKWACACSVWKWACALHDWIRVKYKEAINTFKALWAEHTQHLSGAERLDPEMRLHLSWLTRNQIGPTTKEKVEKDAWVFLKISSSYKFPSWESLLAALVPFLILQASSHAPSVAHLSLPTLSSCSYVQTQNVVHIIIWKV